MSTSREPVSPHEDLSALVDGALGKSETAFLLRRLEHDAQLRDCYSRYHLIGDCLRQRAHAMPVRGDFAERVRQAVAAESTPRRALPWRAGAQWAAGVFTAAIVAAGAFWYVQPRPGADNLSAQTDTGNTSEVQSSGVRADDLRRQLPLLPVAARASRPLSGEFAPQPDPEAWQRAQIAPLHYPSTQYVIIIPAPRSPPTPAEPPR